MHKKLEGKIYIDIDLFQKIYVNMDKILNAQSLIVNPFAFATTQLLLLCTQLQKRVHVPSFPHATVLYVSVVPFSLFNLNYGTIFN